MGLKYVCIFIIKSTVFNCLLLHYLKYIDVSFC
jgi:hypothetical protein